ncbi:MAG: hypothetical protein AAF184_09145 [Pseudomonadota bacterium]
MPTNGWDRAALVLVGINLIVATAHCLDNIVFFHRYPEPDWITGPHIVDMLFIVALIGLAVGYFAFRARRRGMAALGLGVFSLISVSALGHYLYAPMSALTLRMNLLILLEAGGAVVLAGFVVLSQWRWQRGVIRSLPPPR